MVHAMRLVDALGHAAPVRAALWASVYIHDLERRHDGECTRHGRWPARRLTSHPDTQAILAAGKIAEGFRLAIRTAVTFHSLPRELPSWHPNWTLTALLKDADALDRVRLGDLDPAYLRFKESHAMIDFAEALFHASEELDEGAGLFPELVGVAEAILGG